MTVMPNEPRAQAYLYVVLLPNGGPPAWGPAFNGRRAAQFAAATGCDLVRWPVQIGEVSGDGNDPNTRWRDCE